MFVNKKLFRWVGIGIIVTIVAVSIPLIINYMSYIAVSFVVAPSVSSATIYSSTYPENGESSKITSINRTSEVRLKPGTYFIAPNGSNITTDAYEVQVSGATKSIDINPYYSTEYLSTQFSAEATAINSLVRGSFTNATSGYSISGGTFYHFGEWYGATLYKSPDINGVYDFYGVIAHKVDGVWQIAAGPALLFNYATYPNIPRDVIYSVNAAVNGF